MKFLRYLRPAALLGCLAFTTSPLLAQTEPRGYYATIYGQASQLRSTTFNEIGNAGFGSGLKADFGSGFGLGGDIGFRYGNGWAAEVEWNYRSHDLKSLKKGSATLLNDGDLASNILFVNGLRRFVSPDRSWVPFVGLGIGWVQEIDFDLNTSTNKRAWSDQGKIAMQLIGGAEFKLNDAWRLVADVRFLRLGSVELPAEEGVTGRLDKVNYNPVSVQLGIRRVF
jgi:opacity protein-like surface antigen